MAFPDPPNISGIATDSRHSIWLIVVPKDQQIRIVVVFNLWLYLRWRCCTDRVSSVNTGFCHDHGYA